MKLFLTSHRFGDFADELKTLVGDNRRTLLITNARDYYDPAERQAKVNEHLAFFAEQGFDTTELDLRPYFNLRPEELEQFVTDYNPGLIFAIGGDMFMLATALAVSGMDDIIKARLAADLTVYGGNSAGAIVASHDVEIYERDELHIEEIGSYYGTEAITNGLGLIPEYIIPHVDVAKFQQNADFYRQQLQKIHADIIELGEADAYIVSGHDHYLRRGTKS